MQVHLNRRRLELVDEPPSNALPPAPRCSHTLSSDLLRKFLIVFDMAIELIEVGADSILLSEDVPLDPPWEDSEALVTHVGAGWDAEDVVEFFECEFLAESQLYIVEDGSDSAILESNTRDDR